MICLNGQNYFYLRALGRNPGKMLLFSSWRSGFVRFNFTKLFDVNEFVVGRIGQCHNNVGFDSGVVEQSDPYTNLLSLATVAGHFNVHVERPISGEFADVLDQTETVFRADGKSRNDPVSRNFRNLDGKNGMAVRTNVDVLPQPRILVHAE